MNPLAIELTRLIGKKELTQGCLIKITEATDSYNEGGLCEYGGPVEENIYTLGGYFLESEGMDANFIKNWKKEVGDYILNIEILNHPATLSDFHMWAIKTFPVPKWEQSFEQDDGEIAFALTDRICYKSIPYDSSKDLLPAYEGAHCQSEETLKQIVELIYSNQ